MAIGKTRIDDDETRDVSSVELAAALPFQRSAAVSRVPGPLDIASHARLAARLVAAPTAAEDDLRALGLVDRDLRARADAAVMEVVATDRNAALAWTAAFERELARFV
jgi:hypothetical protein